MDLETLWYEMAPFVYGICGVCALVVADGSRLWRASGFILIAVALAILWRRWGYRRSMYIEVPHVIGKSKPSPSADVDTAGPI
jgi:hypothetical protein